MFKFDRFNFLYTFVASKNLWQIKQLLCAVCIYFICIGLFLCVQLYILILETASQAGYMAFCQVTPLVHFAYLILPPLKKVLRKL